VTSVIRMTSVGYLPVLLMAAYASAETRMERTVSMFP
jgi:hypothetical protein